MECTRAASARRAESTRTAGVSPTGSADEDCLRCPSEFASIRVLSRGAFGKVELVLERSTGRHLVLKYRHKLRTRMSEYLREFQTGCRLIHPAILLTHDRPVESERAFIIVQEYAVRGDLLEAITPQRGLDEDRAKSCLLQTASALAFMHKRLLVHGNVKPEHVLVFDADMAVVKLSDFRHTQRRGDTVTKRASSTPYTAPEVCSTVVNEGYTADYSQDIWAFGVLVFCVLLGVFPWGTATPEDTSFRNFAQWQKRRVNRTPLEWRRLSAKMQKLLKKVLDPAAGRRCPVGEIDKYAGEAWLSDRTEQGDRANGNPSGDDDGLPCAGDMAAMRELRAMLESHGVVTCSDSSVKRRWIDEWVQAACQQSAGAAGVTLRTSSR